MEEFDYSNLVPEWNYAEFNGLKRINPERTLYARGYEYNEGNFYLEPWFYTQLTRLFERFPLQIDDILAVFFSFVDKSKFVLFTKDINNPVFVDASYTCIEINEIIIAANLTIDDISRGSDYGD